MATRLERLPGGFEGLSWREPARPAPSLVLIGCAALAVVFLAILLNPGGMPTMVAAGLACTVILASSVAYTIRHRDTVIIAVLLAEMLSSNAFVPSGASTAIRYSMNALFCLPLIPSLWRSGVMGQGGFRLLAVYFGWCLVTVAWSLAPVYSLGRAFSSMLLVAGLIALALDVSSGDDVTRLIGRFLVGCALVVAIQAAAALVLPHSITFASPEMLDANGMPIPGTTSESSGGIARFVGIFTQPNQVGALAIVTVGMSLACWRRVGQGRRIILAALALVALALGVLADSRSALGATAFGIVVFLLWKYRWRGAFAVGALAVVSAIALSLAVKDIGAYVGRGDVSTLTGRTDVWQYSIEQIKESPILGYGYEVEGQIYQLRYFPLWWGPWDEGPRSSLHNNYISHMIGVGIPAFLLWLFIMLRPWFVLFRRKDDPWDLKPIALLVILPLLILNFAESGAGDCHYATGVAFVLCWAVAERARLLRSEDEQSERKRRMEAMSPVAAAIASCASGA